MYNILMNLYIKLAILSIIHLFRVYKNSFIKNNLGKSIIILTINIIQYKIKNSIYFNEKNDTNMVYLLWINKLYLRENTY